MLIPQKMFALCFKLDLISFALPYEFYDLFHTNFFCLGFRPFSLLCHTNFTLLFSYDFLHFCLEVLDLISLCFCHTNFFLSLHTNFTTIIWPEVFFVSYELFSSLCWVRLPKLFCFYNSTKFSSYTKFYMLYPWNNESDCNIQNF